MPRYAAIDIGSNSVRMEAAEVTPGQPTRILASDREITRLGESVFREGAVSEGALEATCAVLARMASLYRKLEVAGVRAVATSAIRDTRNRKEFVERASAVPRPSGEPNPHFLRNTTTASGGSVTAMLCLRLCLGMGREDTEPPLPIFEPPNNPESVFRISS